MKPILTAIVFLFVLSACGNNSKQKAEFTRLNAEVADLKKPPGVEEISSNATGSAPEPTTIDQKSKEISKKIIKEGDISFETGNIDNTRNAINSALQKLGGYAAAESEVNNNDNGRKEYTIRARIPAKNFDLFLTNVSASAEKIDIKNIKIKDVTSEFIDITAQLDNKKKLEQHYLELLKRGDKIADLLQIENKLTEIRTDIESTQAQLNYLTKQVEYSSLDITFYSRQLIKEDAGPSFLANLKTSFLNGWDILGSLFFGFIGWWPIWIIVIVLYVLLKTWRKKRRLRKANP